MAPSKAPSKAPSSWGLMVELGPKQKELGTHGGPLPTNTFSMQGLFTKGGLLSVGALVSLKHAEVASPCTGGG